MWKSRTPYIQIAGIGLTLSDQTTLTLPSTFLLLWSLMEAVGGLFYFLHQFVSVPSLSANVLNVVANGSRFMVGMIREKHKGHLANICWEHHQPYHWNHNKRLTMVSQDIPQLSKHCPCFLFLWSECGCRGCLCFCRFAARVLKIKHFIQIWITWWLLSIWMFRNKQCLFTGKTSLLPTSHLHSLFWAQELKNVRSRSYLRTLIVVRKDHSCELFVQQNCPISAKKLDSTESAWPNTVCYLDIVSV